MTAIVFPHVCCNDGIITDLSGYGCILGNLGLEERLNKKFDKTGGTISGPVEIKAAGCALKMTAPTENAANYIELFGADKRQIGRASCRERV